MFLPNSPSWSVQSGEETAAPPYHLLNFAFWKCKKYLWNVLKYHALIILLYVEVVSLYVYLGVLEGRELEMRRGE
jgi:hypothetical protein